MSGRRWTPEEVEILVRDYPLTRTADLAARLGRAERAVFAQAHLLGLKKIPDYLCGPDGPRFQAGNLSGHRFAPGQSPWNKGKKGLDMGGKATRFQPGQLSGRAASIKKPLGWLRVGKDGIVQIKVSEDRPFQRRWKALHTHVWEQTHGPVPAGHIVVFADGDRENFDLNNLRLVTRAENMARNTVHRFPKELAELVQLLGALNRKINARIKA